MNKYVNILEVASTVQIVVFTITITIITIENVS